MEETRVIRRKESKEKGGVQKPREVLRIHSDFVSSIVLFGNEFITASEDGRILYSSEEEGTYNVQTHEQPINHLALNADESLLLACSDDQSIYIYRTDDFEEVSIISGFDDTGIRKAVFTSNHRILASCNSGQIGIYDLETKKIELFNVHEATVDAIAIHPSKNLVLTNDMSGKSLIWDLERNEVIHTLTESRGTFVRGMFHYGANSAIWTDDYIIIGEENILLFNQDYELIHTIKGVQFPPSELCLHNGILWACTNNLLAWDIKSFTKLCNLEQETTIYSAKIDRKGRLLTGHAKGSIKKWNPESLWRKDQAVLHNGEVQFIATNEKYIASSSKDKSIIIWDWNGQALNQKFSDDNNIAVVDFLNVSELLFIENSSLRTLNIETMEVTEKGPIGINFSPYGVSIQNKIAYIFSMGDNSRLIKLDTLETYELKHEIAFLECSNPRDNRIALNCYTNFTQDHEESKEEEDKELIEAPLVIYDFIKNELIETLWLDGQHIWGEWSSNNLYPSATIFEKDRIIAGYSTGIIALWDSTTYELISKSKHSENYIRYIVKVGDENYLINNGNLYLADHNLAPVLHCDLGDDLNLYLVDQEHNLAVVYSIYGKTLYFIDLESLDVIYTFPLKSIVDFVLKKDTAYFVFTRANLEVFDISNSGSR